MADQQGMGQGMGGGMQAQNMMAPTGQMAQGRMMPRQPQQLPPNVMQAQMQQRAAMGGPAPQVGTTLEWNGPAPQGGIMDFIQSRMGQPPSQEAMNFVQSRMGSAQQQGMGGGMQAQQQPGMLGQLNQMAPPGQMVQQAMMTPKQAAVGQAQTNFAGTGNAFDPNVNPVAYARTMGRQAIQQTRAAGGNVQQARHQQHQAMQAARTARNNMTPQQQAGMRTGLMAGRAVQQGRAPMGQPQQQALHGLQALGG